MRVPVLNNRGDRMCDYSCPLCHGWKSNCPGVTETISRLEDRVRLASKKIKWLKEQLKEYEIELRGKDPKKWVITQK